MRVRANSTIARWCQRSQFRPQTPAIVEQLFRMVTAHPAFNQLQVCRIGNWIRNRHLMRTPGAFQSFAVKFLWAGPSFRSSHHDHRPSWTTGVGGGAFSCLLLNLANLEYATLKRSSHQLMCCLRLVTLYNV